jgi:hypothetical protein
MIPALRSKNRKKHLIYGKQANINKLTEISI